MISWINSKKLNFVSQSMFYTSAIRMLRPKKKKLESTNFWTKNKVITLLFLCVCFSLDDEVKSEYIFFSIKKFRRKQQPWTGEIHFNCWFAKVYNSPTFKCHKKKLLFNSFVSKCDIKHVNVFQTKVSESKYPSNQSTEQKNTHTQRINERMDEKERRKQERAPSSQTKQII